MKSGDIDMNTLLQDLSVTQMSENTDTSNIHPHTPQSQTHTHIHTQTHTHTPQSQNHMLAHTRTLIDKPDIVGGGASIKQSLRNLAANAQSQFDDLKQEIQTLTEKHDSTKQVDPEALVENARFDILKNIQAIEDSQKKHEKHTQIEIQSLKDEIKTLRADNASVHQTIRIMQQRIKQLSEEIGG